MDIHTIDLDFQGMEHAIASYLVTGPEGPVLIETGPASTIGTLVERLGELGYEPRDVRHVFVTHIHLDHAGAAGWWAQQGANVYVHEVGAPHLIDPSRLLSSAARIYGDQMDMLWGETLPAPKDRVTALSGGEVVRAAGLEITAIDTPGHASHHLVYRLNDVAFTGDAAGVRILRSPLVDIPAVPPEFNREVWFETLTRLRAEGFEALYLTHFGSLEDVTGHLDAVRELIAEASGFVQALMRAGLDRDAIVELYTEWNLERAAAAGVSEENIGQSSLANPMAMSVDGISRYWRKKWQRAGAS
jgi:glyoxylase-like metal-dependent hydrolase (beta-lactamase superfamily II)